MEECGDSTYRAQHPHIHDGETVTYSRPTENPFGVADTGRRMFSKLWDNFKT